MEIRPIRLTIKEIDELPEEALQQLDLNAIALMKIAQYLEFLCRLKCGTHIFARFLGRDAKEIQKILYPDNDKCGVQL
jgi:hypothetical protein